MSVPATFPTRQLQSTTTLTVGVALRLAVVLDNLGGHLEPEVVVSLAVGGRRSRLSPAAIADASSAIWSAPGSLRKAFDSTHPRTAALLADLSARSEQFLAGLRMGETVADVVTFGQALEIVHRELAAADRMRREWIARQGRVIHCAQWDLTMADVVPVERNLRTLPADFAVPEGVARLLAGDYGVLVAAVEDDASPLLYRRAPQSLPDGVVTADSAGPGPTSTGSASSGSVGAQWVRDDGPDSRDDRFGEIARLQLDLLDCFDEHARLASTHARGQEVACLEQEARLGRASARISLAPRLPRQRS